uniref:Protein-tyrosine-phosphatase n=1 Tax=Syphacia muris TaxID=451379 RepID=A0A0N5AN08_9BILA
MISSSVKREEYSDPTRQWWILDNRFQVLKPFYELFIAVALPRDSGVYQCHLETDPLFPLAVSSATIKLLVMLRPSAPKQLEIGAVSYHSVTLKWKQDVSPSQSPILQNTIYITQLDDNSVRKITLVNNATMAHIPGLLALTEYSFRVSAENSAGVSELSRPIVQPLKGSPQITGISNTTDGCIEILWYPPKAAKAISLKYRVTIRHFDSDNKREFRTQENDYTICQLPYNSVFELKIEADNGYGYSPPAVTRFQTDQSIPNGPPENVTAKALSHSTVELTWLEPEQPNGDITAYRVFIQRAGDPETKSLLIYTNGVYRAKYAYNVTDLEPYQLYIFRISAATIKGESEPSKKMNATTDYQIPSPPVIINVSYDCANTVLISWRSGQYPGQSYRLYLEGHTARYINTTHTQVNVTNLEPHRTYTVKVLAAVQSVIFNTSLDSEWSKKEIFLLDDNCLLHSSICSSPRCKRLANGSEGSASANFLVTTAVLFPVILASVVFIAIKRRFLLAKKKRLTAKKLRSEDLTSVTYDKNYGRTIPVTEFNIYCQELSQNNNQRYKQQFEMIEKDSTFENGNGMHRSRDRYLDVCALEQTRIKIVTAESSDYINANYVDSCEKRNAYIATQAPLPHTFADFWSMVWQQQSNVIVMITNLVEHGRRKCDQYWPNASQSAQVHGRFIVSLDSEKQNLHFAHRVFNLKPTKCSMHEREIHQLHFTSWPDHGVPDTVFPLLSFMQYVSEIQTVGPIIVHCSAGIGRSGSYMLIDSMRQHLQCENSLNIDAHLRHIRHQRAKLVQTLDQYIFCHKAICQMITSGKTRVHIDDFIEYFHYLSHNIVNDRTQLQIQYEDICRCNHSPQCTIGIGYETFSGYHHNTEFIVATWPKESTDLWTLVWEKNCQTVVLLAGDEDFWCRTIKRAGDLKIQQMNNDMVILSNSEDQLCVRTLYVSQSDFELDTWTEIGRIQHRRLQYHDSPLVILNPGRSSNAYILCLLTSIACQIEAESSLDVLLFLTAYKQKLCGVWKTQCDLEVIYDKLLLFIANMENSSPQ